MEGERGATGKKGRERETGPTGQRFRDVVLEVVPPEERDEADLVEELLLRGAQVGEEQRDVARGVGFGELVEDGGGPGVQGRMSVGCDIGERDGRAARGTNEASMDSTSDMWKTTTATSSRRGASATSEGGCEG